MQKVFEIDNQTNAKLILIVVRADLVFQKSAKKRAEATKMMEKEMADTSARQEKVDHKLKERIGNKH